MANTSKKIDIRLRPMTTEDIWTIARLWERNYANNSNKYPDLEGEMERFAEFQLETLSNPNWFSLLIILNNQIKGFIQWNIFNRPFGKPHRIAMISHIINEGISVGHLRRILHNLFMFFKQIGIEQVETIINYSDLKKYQRRGYIPHQVIVHTPVEHYLGGKLWEQQVRQPQPQV